MSDLQCPTTLVCVRHGAYVGAPIWTSEPPGPGLTDVGREQARALVPELAGRNVRHVWTSHLRRAEETGDVLCSGLGVGRTVLAGLREVSYGDVEGLSDPSVIGDVDAAFVAWLEGDLDRRVRGGDSGREVLDRVADALQTVADQHRGETVVVVAHGGVLGLALAALCAEVSPALVLAHPLANCDRVEVVHDGDAWRATSWAGEPLGPPQPPTVLIKE